MQPNITRMCRASSAATDWPGNRHAQQTGPATDTRNRPCRLRGAACGMTRVFRELGPHPRSNGLTTPTADHGQVPVIFSSRHVGSVCVWFGAAAVWCCGRWQETVTGTFLERAFVQSPGVAGRHAVACRQACGSGRGVRKWKGEQKGATVKNGQKKQKGKRVFTEVSKGGHIACQARAKKASADRQGKKESGSRRSWTP